MVWQRQVRKSTACIQLRAPSADSVRYRLISEEVSAAEQTGCALPGPMHWLPRTDAIAHKIVRASVGVAHFIVVGPALLDDQGGNIRVG